MSEKKKYARFSREEDEKILRGVKLHGTNWELVKKDGGGMLAGRLPKAIAQRFNTLTGGAKKKMGEGVSKEEVSFSLNAIFLIKYFRCWTVYCGIWRRK